MKRTTIIGWGVSLLVLVGATAQAARPYYDLSVDVGHEENLLRAEADADRLDDTRVDLSAAVSYPVALGEHSGLYLRGAVEHSKYQHYRGFDNLRIGGSATWRYKPDLHFAAPWFSVGLKLEDWEYDSSELRDSHVWELEAMTGKRFTDRLSGRIGAAYRERRATTDRLGLLGGNRLFDMTNRRWFAGLDYRRGRFTWYGQYTFQGGDVVSTAVPTHKIIFAADEIQFDDAAPFAANGRARFGYRLNADTRLLDLGVNVAVSRSAAIDVMLRGVDVEAVGGNVYDDVELHVAYLHRFK